MENSLAELMREARKKSGLKQADLAKKFGVQTSTISNWEKGLAMPNINFIVAYCTLCGVNYLEVLIKVFGDPTNKDGFFCTPDEVEMIRRYRFIDERGKRTVRRILDAEYNDAMSAREEEPPDEPGTG